MLLDVDQGDLDRAVEDAFDMVDVEYHDVFVDIAGDRDMDSGTIDAALFASS